MHRPFPPALGAIALALLAASPIQAKPAGGPGRAAHLGDQGSGTPQARKPDLADLLAGAWHGAVISDSQGSSRDGVTLTLTRTGPNTVQITSDYPRLPVITVRVERAMQAIVQADGDTAFVYAGDKQPPTLDVSFHNEVSWSGTRE
ncbi:hypothetical protein [Novosphingobium lentum]|uniref:hypothetical protein n=1 Tax=Novosphingobium lentum TaxID=145287 RepID=UPI000AE5034A|nr:hypothetical protein [Novosphingobium lentum]